MRTYLKWVVSLALVCSRMDEGTLQWNGPTGLTGHHRGDCLHPPWRSSPHFWEPPKLGDIQLLPLSRASSWVQNIANLGESVCLVFLEGKSFCCSGSRVFGVLLEHPPTRWTQEKGRRRGRAAWPGIGWAQATSQDRTQEPLMAQPEGWGMGPTLWFGRFWTRLTHPSPPRTLRRAYLQGRVSTHQGAELQAGGLSSPAGLSGWPPSKGGPTATWNGDAETCKQSLYNSRHCDPCGRCERHTVFQLELGKLRMQFRAASRSPGAMEAVGSVSVIIHPTQLTQDSCQNS